MAEAQNIGITLDDKSIQILKKVDKLHRDSIINVALALVEKTGYYKTLAGISESEELDDVASLDILDDEGKSTKSKKTKSSAEAPAPAKKPQSSWDSF
jgi:hypothetical protein